VNLYEEIERNIDCGYNEENAKSKLGQDIVLKAIADCGMSKNATIKGGVVMRSISKDARRATNDFDMDFIRYSISDESIHSFVEKMNCIDGLEIKLEGKIIELNHQDYKGKRINIIVSDAHKTSISLKMDIGVHNDLSIEQEEYAFDVGFQEDKIVLLINSPAQMITEKLKSMVRFGSRNTRYKDVFDICYLSEYVEIERLKECIKKYIFNDDTLKNVTNMNAIIERIEGMFSNPEYVKELQSSNKNWLNISEEEVMKKDLAFIKSIKF